MTALGDRGLLAGVRLGLVADASPDVSDLEEALLREGALVERMHPNTSSWSTDANLDLVIIRIERATARSHRGQRLDMMQALAHTRRVMALLDEPLREDLGSLCDFALPPFSPSEVIPRILRALRTPYVSSAIRVGNAEFNVSNRTLTVAGEPVDLTFAEFEMFHALLAANGGVLSREELQRHIGSSGDELRSRRIDIHIHRLRAKLRRMTGASVDTVRNVGYRLTVDRLG
ncbi:MAG: winged helix-turn-helix domain-containing protein [Dehalococcoidia bacterium]|nr:winged helix-turn-helix domain-containing protein [Dehalococcoidia bacterium]